MICSYQINVRKGQLDKTGLPSNLQSRNDLLNSMTIIESRGLATDESVAVVYV